MVDGAVEIGRLAMRVEGDDWCAYYAPKHTMIGALRLGQMKMVFVQKAERKKAFMDLMREAVSDIIESKIGTRPEWGGEERAPENERAGRA